MKINTFKFYVKEATANIFKNGWMGFASIFTIFCCLVMFGLFMGISQNATYMIDEVQADYDVPVIIDGSKSIAELNSIAESIRAIPGVSEISIVTKEDGLEIVKDMLKEYEGLADGLDTDNPLRHTIKVNLSDLSQADEIIAKIKEIPGIESINTRYELRDTLINITNLINNSSLWIMLVLVVISIFIISNTIKLAVFTRRKEINIMKFVGATDWFIRWPFVIEGIIIGLFGCAFAFFAVGFAYNIAYTKFAEIHIIPMLGFDKVWPLMLLSFIFFSVVLGAMGSFISIRKHLKV